MPDFEGLFISALGLSPPWTLEDVELDESRGRVDILASFAPGSRFDCAACGAERQPVHDTRRRQWQHLFLFQYKAVLTARVPRTRCVVCGKTTQVPVPWARPGSGFTLMFEGLVLALAPHMAVRAIARTLGCSHERLWPVIGHHVEKARANQDYSSVFALGIDETAARRGHDYITLVHDAGGRRVLFACEGRDSSTLEAFVKDFKAHGGKPDNVCEACSDMASGYIKGIAEHLPKALHAFDPFHVVALANKALDQVRRKESKSEPQLRGTRYVWLKDASRWTYEQICDYHHLSRTRLATARAYRLKEALRDIYRDTDDPEQALVAIKRWCSWASRSRLTPFKQLARTIRKHLDGVLAFFVTWLANGFVESINSLIQAAKARARGYKRRENLITMVYLIAGRLTGLPENPLRA